jgi:hypothetical protein
MTANDLRYNILLGVDSLFEGTAPGYNDKQISAIINRAQRRVFSDKAPLFDANEKIKRILSPLTKRVSLVSGDISATTEVTITDFPHTTELLTGEFFTLPTDVGFIVEEAVAMDDDTDVSDLVIVLPITYDYFLKNYRNKYKQPLVNNRIDDIVWRLDAMLDDGHPCIELIYPDGFAVDNYIITYLRYPNDITVNIGTPANQVDCEIKDQSFQDEIVSESIKIITASLNDEGYQVAVAEKKFDE